MWWNGIVDQRLDAMRFKMVLQFITFLASDHVKVKDVILTTRPDRLFYNGVLDVLIVNPGDMPSPFIVCIKYR